MYAGWQVVTELDAVRCQVLAVRPECPGPSSVSVRTCQGPGPSSVSGSDMPVPKTVERLGFGHARAEDHDRRESAEVGQVAFENVRRNARGHTSVDRLAVGFEDTDACLRRIAAGFEDTDACLRRIAAGFEDTDAWLRRIAAGFEDTDACLGRQVVATADHIPYRRLRTEGRVWVTGGVLASPGRPGRVWVSGGVLASPLASRRAGANAHGSSVGRVCVSW
jgi:hypothetical protein